MQRYSRITFVVFMGWLWVTGTCYALQTRINSINYESAANHSKLILGVTASPKHRVFVIDNPSRLVIDVKNSQITGKIAQPAKSHPLFGRVRSSVKNELDLRIVVDLKQTITGKTHKLVSNNADNKRLLIDLIDKKLKVTDNEKQSPENVKEAQSSRADSDETETRVIKSAGGKIKNVPKKRFIVAIDAGHGGDDPGAHGPHGTHEKQVTLAIAKKLEGLVDSHSEMRAKLVRKGDYYVGLRERMKIARKLKADLFISIHADAVDNPSVRGASVYALSRNGASSEAARWLANSENSKEKIGGVELEGKEEVLATVLLDLSQTATQQASLSLAEKVLKNFRNISDLHYSDVQKAGFMVLKSPDIPSILVETAYISNPSDELNLLSHRYQAKMADAIYKGILNYYQQTRPEENNRMAKL